MNTLLTATTCGTPPPRPLLGGKGEQLARLAQHNLPVPPWVCLSTAAFQQVLAPYLAANTLATEEATLHAQIQTLPWPSDLQAALTRAIGDLLQSTAAGAISVRSSATVEDAQGATYAGQFETFLGITDVATALDKIKACWASLWSAHAQHYRARQGNAHEAAMAVILQALVPADSAGVLFTVNPLTQGADEVVIEANWGLGEPLVSGEIVPDHYVVQMDPVAGLPLHLRASQIGSKAEGLFWHGINKRLERRPNLTYFRQRPVLTQAQLFRLATLGASVQRTFGAPQDIEWAMVGDELYLLQTRPITTIQQS